MSNHTSQPELVKASRTKPKQLALNFKLDDLYTFATFVTQANPVLVNSLQHAFQHPPEPWLLWQPFDEGKTHLLQALVQWVLQQQKRCLYLPLKEVLTYGPAVLEGLEQFDLIALDDVHLLAAHEVVNQQHYLVDYLQEWEEALFYCINRLRQAGTILVTSLQQPPAKTAFALADLQSRLSASAVFQLQALDDQAKKVMLAQRAQAYGLTLDQDCGLYLLTHYPRSNYKLCRALDRLNTRSLETKRRITIPFIRETLAVEKG